MKRRINWFTVASISSLCAMLVLALVILVTPLTTTIDELGVLVVLGFASIVAAIFSIHDTVASELKNIRERVR